jgi:hypothetical protein
LRRQVPADRGRLAAHDAEFRANRPDIAAGEPFVEVLEQRLDVLHRRLDAPGEAGRERDEETPGRRRPLARPQRLPHVDNRQQTPPVRGDDATRLEPDPYRDHVVRFCARIHVDTAHDDDQALSLGEQAGPGFAGEQDAGDVARHAALAGEPIGCLAVRLVDIDPQQPVPG